MGMVTLGSTDTGLSGLIDILHHLVLPTITLGAYNLAIYARLLRASMLEVLAQDFINTARAKGLSGKAVYYKHALRNALLPVITIAGLQIGFMFTGAVLTETIFAWPGMGRLLVESILARDYAVVQTVVFFAAMVIVVVNILVDLMYAWLDPRIRVAA
jgi:peptide/nickel transport system permease protein